MNQKEQLAAQGLIDAGYKVIRQMADTPYSSQTACGEEGVMAVGYGTDVTPYASCSLVTNEWDWGAYYVERVKAALDGTWKPNDWWGGFEADAIKMTSWNDTLVPAEARQKARATGRGHQSRLRPLLRFRSRVTAPALMEKLSKSRSPKANACRIWTCSPCSGMLMAFRESTRPHRQMASPWS